MYTRLQLAKKYILYYLTASSGKGHGIHSPFVFDFIKNVLRDKKKYDWYSVIETGRQKLLQQTAAIEVTDFGAGSSVIKTGKRVVADIAKSSLKPKKYAQLLYRMVNYYKPTTILELGTSFGITTGYLAAGNAHAKVYRQQQCPETESAKERQTRCEEGDEANEDSCCHHSREYIRATGGAPTRLDPSICLE